MKTFYQIDFTAEVKKGQQTKKSMGNERENKDITIKGKEIDIIVGPCEHEEKWPTDHVS